MSMHQQLSLRPSGNIACSGGFLSPACVSLLSLEWFYYISAAWFFLRLSDDGPAGREVVVDSIT